MNKIIQKGLVFLVFAVPLVFSHSTTEIYGLIKWTLLEFGVFALLVLWLIQLINSGTDTLVSTPQGQSPSGTVPSLRSQSLNLAVLAFFAAALLSLIKAGNKYEGVMSIYQLGAGVGLFFLAANNVKEKKDVNQIVLSMALAGVIACLFCLYEIRGIKFSTSRLAYTSTFGNPIFFAQYLSFVIPVSVAMCFQKRQEKQGTDTLASNKADIRGVSPLLRVFYGLASLFMLVFVILARSRGAYVGLFAAALYCYFVFMARSSKGLKKTLIAFTVICLFAAAIGLKGSTGESKRLRNLMRVYVWGSVFQMVKDHPLLGVGTGNFKVTYPLYRSPEEREITPKGVTYSKAHNDFLQVWAETGTLGLVCFLWILFALFFQTRASPLRGEARIELGVSAALVALLSQALFNPMLYVPASAMGFWLLLGLYGRIRLVSHGKTD